jgi:NAD(P)-dependent dehydrogenase (short-subunit alcohol dehydrogenase family)
VKVEDKDSLPKDVEQRIQHIPCDISNVNAVEDFISEIASKGIDILINNAGITEKMPAKDVDDATFRRIQGLNVDALFRMTRLCYPYLKQSSSIGRVINVSSMAAHLGFSEVVPYCGTKAAVTGITRGLAVEWAEENILVNSVAPGWFPSEMNKQVMDEDRQQKILARMPMHRYGKSSELAHMVLFLSSSASTYITGQDFAVDGGALAFGY